MTSISGSLVPLPTVTPLTSVSGSLVPVPIPSSLSTQATVSTRIIYTTTTLCPVTNTITSNGVSTLQVTTAVSTILSTSTSIICTKCIAPMLSTANKGAASPSSSPTAVSSPIPGFSDNPGSSNLSSSSSLLASALGQSSISGVSGAPSSPLVPGSSAVLASGSTDFVSPPAASSPALTQLGSSIRTSAPLPGTTQAVVKSDIVYSTLTSYSVTNTVTPLGGLPTQQVTSTVSTIRSTSISTVCTNCVAPIAPTPGSPAQNGAAMSPALVISESQLAMSIAMSATVKAISESQVAISTLLQALTVASADASIASHLYYYSSQLDVIANPTATNKPTGTSVQVSYITQVNTQAAATSTTLNTAIIPAGIFTPIAHSGASAGASDSGSGTLTSSVTVGQTSTMTSYQVGTSGTGSMDGGSNSTVAKPTQTAFHGGASNSLYFAGSLAPVIAAVAMVICL
ncbi:hypothetical protein N7G274_000306 [Stereocaulon virgatum]|uniref:Uncharacterized protein n=1 Tax=Stereocaulon virgatum TaxID=373712 RepID=A0ABR4ARS8_9LECA